MKIRKDEKQDIEFKQSWRDEYLKWICAFSNTLGGTLYIGVRDDGEVLGVEDSHKLSEDIPNKILGTMGLICEVNLLSDGDKKYFQIRAEKYPFPVSYHGKYYKRSGSTTQEVTGYELDAMILRVHGRTWDSIPVPHVTVNDLDNDAIKIFKKRALEHNRLDAESLNVPNDVLFRNLRLYENEYLTRSAIMCFHPDPENWVQCAYIKIGFFADNDADILYQDEIHGSLIIQVEKALDLIYTKYMKALISYDGIYRNETFFFPKAAFRELLLNAVIHRDYLKPTPIQIKVYEHKIRIWNYGRMPAEVPVEKLFEPHSSEPRNPGIASVFFKAGYVESWGRGYKNITDICKERRAVLPVPEENSGGLVVECLPSEEYLLAEKNKGKIEPNEIGESSKNLPVTDGSSQALPRNFLETSVLIPRNCPVTSEKLYVALCKNPKATNKELSEVLHLSDRTIRTQIHSLKDAGLIERIGSDRSGYWKILDGAN